MEKNTLCWNTLEKGMLFWLIFVWDFNIVTVGVFRGFSTVALVEESLTRRKYALKKIICHSPEDQRLAVREIEYHEIVKHPNVIELIDSDYEGNPDPVFNATSEVLLILPYYHVCCLFKNMKKVLTKLMIIF